MDLGKTGNPGEGKWRRNGTAMEHNCNRSNNKMAASFNTPQCKEGSFLLCFPEEQHSLISHQTYILKKKRISGNKDTHFLGLEENDRDLAI